MSKCIEIDSWVSHCFMMLLKKKFNLLTPKRQCVLTVKYHIVLSTFHWIFLQLYLSLIINQLSMFKKGKCRRWVYFLFRNSLFPKNVPNNRKTFHIFYLSFFEHIKCVFIPLFKEIVLFMSLFMPQSVCIVKIHWVYTNKTVIQLYTLFKLSLWNLKPYIILESVRILMFVEKIEINYPESRGFAR